MVSYKLGVTLSLMVFQSFLQPGFKELRDIGQSNVIPGDMYTNISSRNVKGSKCYDNIWLGKQTRQQAFTGRFGELVFKKKLSIIFSLLKQIMVNSRYDSLVQHCGTHLMKI